MYHIYFRKQIMSTLVYKLQNDTHLSVNLTCHILILALFMCNRKTLCYPFLFFCCIVTFLSKKFDNSKKK